MAKATASAMEWLTWINSTLKQPAFYHLTGLMGHDFGAVQQPMLLQLDLYQTGGERVVCTGALSLLQHIGSPPI